MSNQTYSDLVEIAKRNGDFKKHYGTIIRAYLYLRSVSAVRGRFMVWTGLILSAAACIMAWLHKHGW